MVPFFAAFFSRNDNGSMPSLRARSSIALSVANVEIGAPGARYAATFGRFDTTLGGYKNRHGFTQRGKHP